MDKILAIIVVLVFVGFVALNVAYDIHRWHMFQNVLHTDVGYWKWKMFFDHQK